MRLLRGGKRGEEKEGKENKKKGAEGWGNTPRNKFLVTALIECVIFAHSRFRVNSAFHPSRVGKWVPASAGKEKAGMVHSVSGWTRGVQVKLWDLFRTRAIPERLRGVITTSCYTNPSLPLPYLYLSVTGLCSRRNYGGSESTVRRPRCCGDGRNNRVRRWRRLRATQRAARVSEVVNSWQMSTEQWPLLTVSLMSDSIFLWTSGVRSVTASPPGPPFGSGEPIFLCQLNAAIAPSQ